MEDSIHLIEQMFNRSLLADNELASEKGVILNELNSTLEDPQEKLWEDFFANLFLDCGLGHPIIGYEQIIQDITRLMLQMKELNYIIVLFYLRVQHQRWKVTQEQKKVIMNY
jgi:predicted Zn-dependent peptidase